MIKKLGILGGMGPFATAYFYELLTKMTKVEKEQDYLDVIISSLASTPDRTAFILGKTDKSPLPFLIQEGKNLIHCGAEIIALPCITAHYFYNELTSSLSVPIINLIDLIYHQIREKNYQSVGILTTDGVRESGFLKTYLEKRGISTFYADEENNQNIMKIIYSQLKKGRAPDTHLFSLALQDLQTKGADSVILGCTELSLIPKGNLPDIELIDPLHILVKQILLLSKKELSLD